MGKTGTKVKSRKQQALDAQLSLIIEDMGRAMWNANRSCITRPPTCSHDSGINFTLGMHSAWVRYIEFCRSHPE